MKEVYLMPSDPEKTNLVYCTTCRLQDADDLIASGNYRRATFDEITSLQDLIKLNASLFEPAEVDFRTDGNTLLGYRSGPQSRRFIRLKAI